MTTDDVIEQLASALGEVHETPRAQIAAIVANIGETEALGLLAQTERVESTGGMLVPDGSRARTRGGIFFVLARAKLTSAARRRIFAPIVRQRAELATSAVATPAPITAVASPRDSAEPIAGPQLVRYGVPRGVVTPPTAPTEIVELPKAATDISAADRVVEQIESLMRALDEDARRAVAARVVAQTTPRSKKGAEATDAIEITPALREWVLVGVAGQLDLSTGETARRVFGSDTPANRRRVVAIRSRPTTGS